MILTKTDCTPFILRFLHGCASNGNGALPFLYLFFFFEELCAGKLVQGMFKNVSIDVKLFSLFYCYYLRLSL